MGVFRGLGGLARPFGVLASGAAQLGGFMALQAHDAPQSEAGFFSRVITAASEMARLRWVSGATNQATGGALHRLESEAAVLRERPQATSGSELAQGARAFGRQLALAPLGWVLGIPTEGGIPSDAADNPMNRVTDAVAAGALSRERAMELVVAHLENAAARVGPDVLNAANAALETPYYRPSRSQILQNLWDRIGDGARLRLLRGFPPLTLSTSEDFMLLQSLARFIRSQGGVLETESGYRARGGEVSAETIAPGESSPLALADALTQRAADFRTAVVTACASASAPADREAVVASLRTFSDDEINGLPRALSDPVTRENLPPWMTRNATVILEWMEDHGIRIDRAREAHAEEAYRMREHRIYSENFEVDEEGTATVYAHFPVQDIERFVSETGIEGAAATLSSAFTPAMFLTLNPAVLPNILNGPGGNLIPVCTELAANPGHRLLQEGAPVGTLEDRPHLRRVALRVRRDEVNFVNVEGGARRNVIVNRSWDDFQNRPADERLEESWRNQFYVRTSHIDPARIRVVPTYALTPLTLR